MTEKLKKLINSRRFWAALGAVAFVICDQLQIGLTDQQTTNCAIVIGSWLVGDSIRST